jgi:hypothetical protein
MPPAVGAVIEPVIELQLEIVMGREAAARLEVARAPLPGGPLRQVPTASAARSGACAAAAAGRPCERVSAPQRFSHATPS